MTCQHTSTAEAVALLSVIGFFIVGGTTKVIARWLADRREQEKQK